MAEELRPVDMAKIGSFRGILLDRLTLFGYQPPRDDGARFATLWWTLFGLPIIPLGRYLVKEKDHEYGDTFRNIDLSRKIRFLGRGNLRLKEVLLTYAWAWLICPVIVVLPEMLFVYLMFGVVEGEEDSGWQAILLIFLMGSWPILSLWVAMYMRTRKQGLRPTRD